MCRQRTFQSCRAPKSAVLHKRPNWCIAAMGQNRHQGDYSITSSAVASSEAGTVRPIAFAALRLFTSSNLFGNTTGKSDGLLALQNAACIRADLPIGVYETGAVAREAAVRRKLAPHIQSVSHIAPQGR